MKSKSEIIEFIKGEKIHFGEYASVSKEPDQNGSEYYLVDLLLKFQKELVNGAEKSESTCNLQNVSTRYYDYEGECCSCKRPIATPPQHLRRGDLSRCGICKKPFKRQISWQ